MVLKLDHISFSCNMEYEYEKMLPEGYTKTFEELNLINISCKKQYLSLGAEVHNIFMYEAEDKIPIEVTQYPMVNEERNSIQICERNINLKVADIGAAKEFFVSLGGKVTEDEMICFKPFLDKSSFFVSFCEKEKNERPYLDVCGYSSIGLFVDDVAKMLSKMAEKGYVVTEVSDITVNGKNMKIGFVNGPNGEIVELISLARK